jgi:hypothetical protein
MLRFNTFNLVHKGLRASLYTTAIKLQQTDFLIEEEADEAVNSVREIVMIFEGHAHKEDTFVLPSIVQYEPSVVAAFEDEHVKDLQLGEELNSTIEQLLNSTTDIEKIVSGRKLSEVFVRFLVFNLEHMAKEEDILNKILWRYYTDDKIKQINKQIVDNTPRPLLELNTTWMLRGINNNEATLWMKSIEKEAPAPVFQALFTKAEKELSPYRFRKIIEELTEGVMLA